MSRFSQFASFMILGLLVLVGCNQSGTLDAKTLAEYKTRLALAEEPDGIQTVADVREALLGENPHGHHDHEDHDDAHDEDAHEDHDGEDHEEHEDEVAGHDEEEHGHEHAHDDHDDHIHATDPIEVAIVGHIGGLANPWKTQRDYPFDKTQAVFFLADPQAVVENEASGHSHAPGEECAFCAAHAADNSAMLARVQFLDKNGKVVPADVRQLFDVKEKDTVVVSGTARITEGGMMVVDATGLYIRK